MECRNLPEVGRRLPLLQYREGYKTLKKDVSKLRAMEKFLPHIITSLAHVGVLSGVVDSVIMIP